MSRQTAGWPQTKKMEERMQLTEAEKIERAERLREKTGVSYEQAREALEANDWDILDAIVFLEKLGMASEPRQSSYTTEEEKAEEFKQASDDYEKTAGTGMGEAIGRFFKWCGKAARVGCENTFCIRKNGERLMNVPILVMVILLLSFFKVTVILLIVGLFCRCQYSFHGKLFEGNAGNVNKACDKASETCENIKKEFKKGESQS